MVLFEGDFLRSGCLSEVLEDLLGEGEGVEGGGGAGVDGEGQDNVREGDGWIMVVGLWIS